MRVYRDGRAIGFWEEECQKLQKGDIIVEIIATPNGETRGDGHIRDDRIREDEDA